MCGSNAIIETQLIPLYDTETCGMMFQLPLNQVAHHWRLSQLFNGIQFSSFYSFMINFIIVESIHMRKTWAQLVGPRQRYTSICSIFLYYVASWYLRCDCFCVQLSYSTLLQAFLLPGHSQVEEQHWTRRPSWNTVGWSSSTVAHKKKRSPTTADRPISCSVFALKATLVGRLRPSQPKTYKPMFNEYVTCQLEHLALRAVCPSSPCRHVLLLPEPTSLCTSGALVMLLNLCRLAWVGAEVKHSHKEACGGTAPIERRSERRRQYDDGEADSRQEGPWSWVLGFRTVRHRSSLNSFLR